MKNITLKINGCDVGYLSLPYNSSQNVFFRLVPLNGTLDALMKPAEYKSVVYNDNASIDGSRAILTNRRKNKRTFSLSFWMYAHDDLTLNRALDALEDFLIKGKSPTDNYGLNEITIPELEACYRCVFNKFDNYKRIGTEGVANISLNFTEINPANRQAL